MGECHLGVHLDLLGSLHQRIRKTPSPLWERRKSEMPEDESETNYATEVVSRLDPSRHSEIRMYWDGIAQITAIME